MRTYAAYTSKSTVYAAYIYIKYICHTDVRQVYMLHTSTSSVYVVSVCMYIHTHMHTYTAYIYMYSNTPILTGKLMMNPENKFQSA